MWPIFSFRRSRMCMEPEHALGEWTRVSGRESERQESENFRRLLIAMALHFSSERTTQLIFCSLRARVWAAYTLPACLRKLLLLCAVILVFPPHIRRKQQLVKFSAAGTNPGQMYLAIFRIWRMIELYVFSHSMAEIKRIGKCKQKHLSVNGQPKLSQCAELIVSTERYSCSIIHFRNSSDCSIVRPRRISGKHVSNHQVRKCSLFRLAWPPFVWLKTFANGEFSIKFERNNKTHYRYKLEMAFAVHRPHQTAEM